MTQDYEMAFIEAKIEYYQKCLNHLRYYQIFILPIIKQNLEVCFENKRKMPDLPRDENINHSSHSS